MSIPGHVFPAMQNRVSRQRPIRAADRNRFLLYALVVLAVVPADDSGTAWAMVGLVATVALLSVARRTLRRASAKIDAALTDELDTR